MPSEGVRHPAGALKQELGGRVGWTEGVGEAEAAGEGGGVGEGGAALSWVGEGLPLGVALAVLVAVAAPLGEGVPEPLGVGLLVGGAVGL